MQHYFVDLKTSLNHDHPKHQVDKTSAEFSILHAAKLIFYLIPKSRSQILIGYNSILYRCVNLKRRKDPTSDRITIKGSHE